MIKEQIWFGFECEELKYLISSWQHTTVLNSSINGSIISPSHCWSDWRSFSTLCVHSVSLSLHWILQTTEASSLIVKRLFNVTERRRAVTWSMINKWNKSTDSASSLHTHTHTLFKKEMTTWSVQVFNDVLTLLCMQWRTAALWTVHINVLM